MCALKPFVTKARNSWTQKAAGECVNGGSGGGSGGGGGLPACLVFHRSLLHLHDFLCESLC